MKKVLQCVFIIFLISFTNIVLAQTIWNGPNITFTKIALADPTLEGNQDRITDNVWITRGNTQGLFNAKSESKYNGTSSPSDTEWALGTTDDISSLTFQPWVNAVNNNPPNSLNKNYVLHLISEDIYIDTQFTQWGQGVNGGGSFTYIRSTESPSSIEDINSANSITIFPNPANNFIEVSGEVINHDFEVFEMATGKKVLIGTITKDRQVDISDLENGSYIFATKGFKSVRFIKVGK